MALAWIAVGVACAMGAELAARHGVTARIKTLVATVVEPLDAMQVQLPGHPILLDVSRRRLSRATVTCPHVALPDIAVRDVTLHLSGIVVDASLRIVRGSGVLHGHITAEEVRRQAGVPGGSLELGDGSVTVRWPTRRLPGVRLRPVLSGQRIRLAPSPITFTLRALPEGVSLTDVAARSHGLVVQAELDLPTLLHGVD